MMQSVTEMMMGTGSMTWSMSLTWLFVVLLIGLAGSTLVKFLRFGSGI